MVHLLLASIFLLIPSAFSYSEETYSPTTNREDEPVYVYLDTRTDKSGDKSLRSTLDKNTIRFGRSDLPPLMDNYNTDNDIDPDNLSRSMRAKSDNYMRFGRGGNHFVRFGRGPNDYLRYGRGSSDFMRFGRGTSDFVRFGKGDKNFLRFGRGGNNFLRFGRDSNDSRTIRNLSYLRFGRSPADPEDSSNTRSKRNVFSQTPYKKMSSSFLRFGKNYANDEEASQKFDRQSTRPIFLEKLKQLHTSPIVQLTTDLDCKMEQVNSKCSRLE